MAKKKVVKKKVVAKKKSVATTPKKKKPAPPVEQPVPVSAPVDTRAILVAETGRCPCCNTRTEAIVMCRLCGMQGCDKCLKAKCPTCGKPF